MENIVTDGVSGLHFTPGDPQDLKSKILQLWDNPEQASILGKQAREVYETNYTPQTNYKMLISIYEDVIQNASS